MKQSGKERLRRIIEGRRWGTRSVFVDMFDELLNTAPALAKPSDGIDVPRNKEGITRLACFFVPK